MAVCVVENSGQYVQSDIDLSACDAFVLVPVSEYQSLTVSSGVLSAEIVLALFAAAASCYALAFVFRAIRRLMGF